MSITPALFTKPFIANGQVSTANTSRDGTGTLATIKTGAAGGSKIDEIRVKAAATTTAGMVRLFIDDGATVRLFDEVPIAAVTVSGTVESDEEILTFDNLVLPEGYILKASTHNAEAINVVAFGADA